MAKRSGKVTKRKLSVARVVVKRSRPSSPPPRPLVAFEAFLAKDTPTARKIALIRGGVTARVVDDMVEYFHLPKS